jgi:hypothetical protein
MGIEFRFYGLAFKSDTGQTPSTMRMELVKIDHDPGFTQQILTAQ